MEKHCVADLGEIAFNSWTFRMCGSIADRKAYFRSICVARMRNVHWSPLNQEFGEVNG